jgi:hypothetical protein
MKKEEMMAKIEEQRKLTNIALEEDRVDANDHEVIICGLDWMENLARQLDSPPELTEMEKSALEIEVNCAPEPGNAFHAIRQEAIKKLCLYAGVKI